MSQRRSPTALALAQITCSKPRCSNQTKIFYSQSKIACAFLSFTITHILLYIYISYIKYKMKRKKSLPHNLQLFKFFHQTRYILLLISTRRNAISHACECRSSRTATVSTSTAAATKTAANCDYISFLIKSHTHT